MKKFSKIVLIVFVVVLALCMLVGVVAFFALKNFDLNKFKPQIMAQAQEMLGRRVELGQMQLSFSMPQGLFVSVSGVKISDDPQFSKEDFLAVDRLALGIDVLGVLTKQQLNVSSVEVSTPKVLLVRDEQGHFNFETLKVLQQNDQPQGEKQGKLSKAAEAAPAALAAILVQNIVIKDGVFSLRDHFEDERSLDVKKIDLSILNFSLTKPFKIALKAALFSDKQNVNVAGMGSVDVTNALLTLKNVQSRVDFASMDARVLASVASGLAQAKLQNPFNGQLDCSVDEATIGAKGFSIKKLQGQVLNGEIKTGYLRESVKNIQAQFDIVNNTLNVSSGSCALGSGRIDLKGSVANYLSSQEYDMSVKSSVLDVETILNQANQEVVLEGLASFEGNIKGEGLASLLAFKPNGGKAVLDFNDGKLLNINIFRLVLDKMSMLPDLVVKLEQSLPENYKKKLEEKDTPIKTVHFDMFIDQGNLHINFAQVQTDVFSLTGKGSMDIHLNTQMETRIMIPQDLSKAMIDAVQELRFLANSDGQIVIPLTIEGKIPNKLKYLPDLEYLGRQLFETKGKEELGRLLDKVLDRGQSGDDGSSSQAPSGEEIIGNVLDAIFKK